MFEIRLHVIVVGETNAHSVFPEGYSIETINNLVKELNNILQHASLHFLFDPQHDFEEIFDSHIDYDNMNKMKREEISRKNPHKITLIFRDFKKDKKDINNNNYSGSCSYNVILLKESMKLPSKVAHELGHYFHLAHTFSRQVVDVDRIKKEEEKEKIRGYIKSGRLIDINSIKEKIRKYVEDDGHPIEDGMNALNDYLDGDKINVSDTPYDFGAKIFDTYIFDSHGGPCANDPKIDIEVKFHNGWKHTYTYSPKMFGHNTDIRSNFMSYFNGCNNISHHFSNGQIKVIHKSMMQGNRIRLIQGKEWDSSNAQDFLSPVAVSRKSDTVAVFASNEQGQIMSKVWDASRGTYWPNEQGEWFALGGEEMISPVVISRRSDFIDLFARHITGKISNKFWSEKKSEYWPGNKDWHDNVIGNADSKPTVVARKSNMLDIFVRTPQGTILRKTWDKQWRLEEDLGGEGIGAPAIVARRPDILDLYIRWSDGTIRSKVWSAKKVKWFPSQNGWLNLKGKGFDAPAVVARRPDKIDLFIRWDDGTIRNKVWDDSRGSYWPGNEAWQNLGGNMTSEPVAVCRNPQSIAVFARWVDGTIRLKVWDDSRGSWWPNQHDWYNLGGETVGRPAAVTRNENRVIVYARWIDGSIRTKVWNGERSQWWPGEKAWHSLGTP